MGSRDDVREAFKQFDRNGDGTISREELCAVLQVLRPETFDEKVIYRMFEDMDMDSNGSVCLEEFLEWTFNGSDISKEMGEVLAAQPENYGPPEPLDDEIGEEEEETCRQTEDQVIIEELRVGDFVTVRGAVVPTHGLGRVKPGEVGIVEAVAGESCLVNFPRHEHWRGVCSEMDRVGTDIAVGDTVRVRRSVDHPRFNWGQIVRGESGTIKEISGSNCRIDFVSQENWLGFLPEIERVDDPEALELAVGDHVKVRDCVREPRFQWGAAVPGEVGSVVELEGEGRVRVAFHSSRRWLGFAPELEKVPAEPGWRVRIREDIPEPTLGWRGAQREEVGTIAALEQEGRCRVDFPGAPGWLGLLAELELVPVVAGDKVRVKPGLREPRCGWGRVGPEDAGEVLSIEGAKCRVDFPMHKGWSCYYYELEHIDREHDRRVYPSTGSRVRVKDEVKEPKYSWGKVRHGHVGEVVWVNGLACDVCFPIYTDGQLWSGWLPELEEVEADVAEQSEDWCARGFLPGRIVRVRAGVDPPKYSWGPVRPGDEGRLREVVGDSGRVEFPGLKRPWLAHLPELELVRDEEHGAEVEEEAQGNASVAPAKLFKDGHAERHLDGRGVPHESWLRPGRGEGLADLAVGMMVRVKSSVGRPAFGWGKVKRGDEGELTSFKGPNCKVKFPRQKGLWNGKLCEMEAVNPSVGEQMCLFADIQPQDLKQGRLGNCWVIAGLAALAEFPDAVRLPFSPKSWSRRGHYTVQLYCLETKHWKTIHIDDRLPTEAGALCFAKLSLESELWPALMEKAIAVLFGGYQNLGGGWGPTCWAIITGCENAFSMRKVDGTSTWRRRRMVWHANASPTYNWAKWSDGTSGWTAKPTEELLDLLVAWDNCNYLMCASSHIESSDSKHVEGIVQSHEYSLIRVVKDVAASGVSLLQLRNPWGRKEWHGPWCDESAEWKMHPDICQVLEHRPGDDGLFWMAIEDFARIYDTVCVLELEMPHKQAARP